MFKNFKKCKFNKGVDSSGNNFRQRLADGIYGALNCFNNNILNLSDSNYQKYLKNNKVNVDDVLVLRDVNLEDDSSKNTVFNSQSIYGKILKLGSYSENQFNPSLFNLSFSGNNLVLNESDEITLKNNATQIRPSKIVIVYDITGKVINPGIDVSGIADTSNDALYDSEQNILDNLYRTTIVKKDPNMSYYRNDDNTYTLIDNTVNYVYSLNWKNQINYFASYEDTIRYLKELIKIDTVIVKI